MKKFKYKLRPTGEEIRDRVEKKWKSTKQDAKKKARTRSAKSYREELAKEATKVDRILADLTMGGHRHMDFKKANEF